MLVKGNKNPLTKEEFIEKIIRADTLVIVEGAKDVARLKQLRITKVTQLSRKPLYSFAEQIGSLHNRVILLMDNDTEGRKLFSKLKAEFGRLGVKVDETFQKNLAELKISHVEGL
ncbi:MAG: toprim domain-containing protein [Nanoarchaeota archaeon]|nr:toprim domain-containing protein [Nanoarchaeota archaeon]